MGIMGVYLNPGAAMLLRARASEIYVDKSNILKLLNKVCNTQENYVCISRPRRFGKSMTANLISAYYDRTVETIKVFAGLNYAKSTEFARWAGKFDVIKVNVQEFLSNSESIAELLTLWQQSLLWDLLAEYPDYRYFNKNNLARTMSDIYVYTGRTFVIVIDEWDCIFREYKDDKAAQRVYLDFLRDWLKDKPYISLAYMTGILPIKKYGTHSALNMFAEYSMVEPGPMAEFTGFTSSEVENLCQQYDMSMEETKSWYDGYHFAKAGDIYNPRSVVESMYRHNYANYWNQTETFEALKIYIDMNYEGLKDAIITMMAGDKIKIDVRSFTNDMTTFHNADDIMTLLVHLGYLGYDASSQQVFIPNREILGEFVTATSVSKWTEIIKSVQQSDELLTATWCLDEQKVAEGIARAHLDTSQLQYNDENALSYTVSLAYYSARQYYQLYRELPAGRGFADIIYVPRAKYADKPAMIIELKWNKSAETAITQIKAKKYPLALQGYTDKILLVGINYDRKTEKHECLIEWFDE